ncbi:TPA: hypothetical protein HA219_00960 [Candidatus Woesearchaeota archaeon]|nr:hypothetical protein [Candidatus Woesearchaeota archaeon]HIH39280.1 hypothetical protein [Candidatus Woesearchaeota archaeon]
MGVNYSVLEKAGFKRLIPTGTETGRLFSFDSPLQLETKRIIIETPPMVDIHVGQYLRGRVKQILFASRGSQPSICSIVERSDLKDDLLVLGKAGWLTPSDTSRIFKRHFYAGGNPIKIKDFELHRNDYPFTKSS